MPPREQVRSFQTLGTISELPSSAREIRVFVAIIGIVAAVCAGFSQSVHDLLELWLDTGKTTYTHGLLLAAISTSLIWRRRRLLSQYLLSPSLLFASAFAAFATVWIVTERAGIQLIHLTLLPVLAWLGICAVLGWRVAVCTAFPVAFIYFAIPIWDEVNPILQSATVFAIELMVRATGIPAYIEGNVVHIAAGSFEIAGGCSGLHFFMVGLSLGALYGEMQFDTWRVRLQLLAYALFLSIFSNWVRVYCIVLAGYLTDMQHYLVRVEHYRFGWFVFAVMMTGFFLLARRIPAGESASVLHAAAPRRQLAASKLPLVVLVLASVPLWNLLASVRSAPVPSATDLVPMLSTWMGPELQSNGSWQPVFNGADRAVLARYTQSGGAAIQMYVAAYGHQEQGKELIGYGNSLVSEHGASIVSERMTVPYREIEVHEGEGRAWLIRYAYQIGHVQTTEPTRAQLMYGFAAVRGPVLSRIVAFRAECAIHCDEARRRLEEFQAALPRSDR